MKKFLKAEKLKKRKTKNNKNIDFCLNPYVKNGIFEKKVTLVKQHFLLKKIFILKISHEKTSKT